ncbi:hypothetical protein DFH08DRAFT_898570 [Mycena albidolilacea]|uniref:Uncharacterized protein n=1 Tax=Mycena albidolilacea TaxID=1033008 RepID=A0AAD7EBK9_9AGAR|nr:hypothetical protein DFH08DRAFT_898570 [Mycena albidolilacea]
MKAGGKGKQPKRFLDQSAALGLAESIAGIQEQKSQIKTEKHQVAQIGQPRPERSPRISESKAKLKETKALLAAQRSESKKARNKRRKGLKLSSSTDASSMPPAAKKSVSFA